MNNVKNGIIFKMNYICQMDIEIMLDHYACWPTARRVATLYAQLLKPHQNGTHNHRYSHQRASQPNACFLS
jgi:hypothetical protein